MVVVGSSVGLARAQEPPPPVPTPAPAPAPAAASPAEPTSKLWIGGQLDIPASGSMTLAAGGNTLGLDASAGLGFEGLLDYRVSKLVTIGGAPRLLTGVKPKNNSASGTQYDLRARITVGNFVAPRFRLHGIAHLGYSFIAHIFTVTDTSGKTDFFTSKGFVFGIGPGMSYAINPRLLITAEITYQWGFQGSHQLGMDVTANDSFLTIAGGLVAAIE